MDIVYRICIGSNGLASVVFAERHRAEEVAKIRHALDQSMTWGDLKRNLPDGEWDAHFQPYFADHGEGAPADSEPFDPGDAPGYEDGSYPTWLAQAQLDWFPSELIKEFGGEVGVCVFNGEVLDLPATAAEKIAEALRAMGHTVISSDLPFD